MGAGEPRTVVLLSLGNAEVEYLEGALAALLVYEQVRGFDVAMNDACGVRLGDGVTRFDDVAGQLIDLEWAAALEHTLEILPGEVLHQHVGLARREPTDVVDTGN